MKQTVLETIENLIGEFTPNPIPPLGSSVKLDDPFIHAFDVLRNVPQSKSHLTIDRAFRLYREERHYSLNIATLLFYFLYYLNNYRDDQRVQWDFYSRLTLDVEQLLSNVRSFLDSTFKLALLFSSEADEVPKRRRESFGRFAEWFKGQTVDFNAPLGFISELVPWGLTIRSVRDDYIHRGYEAEPYLDRDEVYFYPFWSDRKIRPMPDLFYREEPIRSSMLPLLRPIYLKKFVVYSAAPVIATELVMGRYLCDLFTSIYGPSPFDENNCPFKASPEIQALYELIIQNKECLERKIYEDTYFTRHNSATV